MSNDASEKATDYTNGSQQLVFAIVDYLSRHFLDPQPLANIVDALGASRDQVFRALWNMQRAGWVRQTGGNYELDVGLTTLAERLRLAIAEILNHRLGVPNGR